MSASSIRRLCDSSDTIACDKVLLWIELQAVVQIIAQNVPYHLLPSQRDNIVQFAPLKDVVNKLLNDDSMGGGARQGHALVVALHLHKLLKSSQKFTELMTTHFDETVKQVECLKSFRDQLQMKSQQEPKRLFLPILFPKDGEQAALYKRVSNKMVQIHKELNGKADLISIAEECRDSQASTGLSIKLHSFRMMVWLVSYFEFYDKKIRSTVLCDFIGSPEMSAFLLEEGHICIIQCFLNPGLMKNCPEVPNPLNDHEQVLELHGRGHQPTKREGQEKDDPLFRLFHEVKQDVDLRHSIAVMVAVIMGLPSRSNHLWYHVFAADELVNTYMTGFMYGSKINRDGLLYDCGVELTPDGKFGRQDYMEHANRGTYTLHSLYPLLWANFGAFCIALLTQPDASTKIHGNIISDWISIRHYCVSQLKTLWMHMRNNYGISDEERTYFVVRAMKTFYEFILPEDAPTPLEESQRGNATCHARKDYFETQDDLDEFELSWHLSVYQPAWNELLSKFSEYSRDWQDELFMKIRQLALLYPQFPSEKDFIHQLLKSDDLQQHFQSGELMLLSRFSMEWPRLKVGGQLLPKLVKLYQWLHTHLAYRITSEKAATLPLHRVIELATKRCDSMDEDILGLYESLKTDYNEYIEQIGRAIGAGACAANKRENKVFTIGDKVPLLHYLTDEDDEQGGNDWLFTVIEDIVSAHNLVIESLYSSVLMCNERQSRLQQHLPEEPAARSITEMDDTNCLVGEFKSLHGISHFLQVVRSRCLSPLKSRALCLQDSERVAFSINGQPKNSTEFQLIQLDEDIITSYIAGKPRITDPNSLRTVFQFRESQKAPDVIPQNVIHSPRDLEAVAKSLPDTFKKEIDTAMLKRFEYGFHSSTHHIMVEVITGLRSVVGHLVKEFIGENEPCQELQELTVSEYMRKHYVLSDTQQEHEVLYEVGITSLNTEQFNCIVQLLLTCSVSCMLHFANWVEEGFYDFCTLPFPLKVHMINEDRRAVDELEKKWTVSNGDLIDQVQQLIDVLKHSERDITKVVNGNPQKPIIKYLVDYHMLDSDDKLVKLIPPTIILEHYVYFRLALRRLKLRLQHEMQKQTTGGEQSIQGRWSEVVCDSWRSRLTNIHQEHDLGNDGMFTYDPATGLYGFQVGQTEDELVTDIMNEPEHTEDVEDQEVAESDDDDCKDGSSNGEESPDSKPKPKISHTYDLDLASYNENEEVNDSVFEEAEPKRNEEKKTSSTSERLPSIEEKACGISVSDVATFLASMKMDKYIETFKDENISGDLLLELTSRGLSELGVGSALGKLKILVGFQRFVETGEVNFSTSKLINALKAGNLEKYCKHFEQHCVDGDLLLHTDRDLVMKMLEEIGISSELNCARIITQFRKYRDIQ